MRKTNIIVLLLALSLVAIVLASAQVSTKKSGAPSGSREAAVHQIAKGSDDPSRFSYPRLYCTPDGNSHFEDVTVDLPPVDFAPPAAPIHIGGNVSASTAFFGGFEAGWGADDLDGGLYHPAPADQFIVTLQGDFTVIATDGESRRLRPGDVIRVEDIPPCKGHITVVGDKPGFFLFAR